MVCLATTQEATKAAIDLARQKAESAEGKLKLANAEIARLKAELLLRVDRIPSYGICRLFEGEAELHGLSIDTQSIPTSDESPAMSDEFTCEDTQDAFAWWRTGWNACYKHFLEKLGIQEKADYDPFGDGFLEPTVGAFLARSEEA